MIAGGEYIRRQLDAGHWTVRREHGQLTEHEYRPLIGPNSLDVTLAQRVLRPLPSTEPVAYHQPASVAWEEEDLRAQTFVLQPRHFVLGAAAEAVDCTTDDEGEPWVQMYEGRSTLARLGLQSHMTAGFGDWGFTGSFTLEIYNCFPRPLVLEAGMRIGQIYFQLALDPRPYVGAYTMDEHRYRPRPPVLGPGRVV